MPSEFHALLGQSDGTSICENGRSEVFFQVEETKATRGGQQRRSLLSTLLILATSAMTMAACSSTAPPDSGTSSFTRSHKDPPIPTSAFEDHTGITASSVSIGNVSTLSAGLFEGAVVGTKAYADYINWQGGVNGRKLIVDSADDQFTGSLNKQLTSAAVQKDLALVGSFSLEDSFGASVLAANSQVPNVAESLSAAANALPNTFNPNPPAGGYYLGPLVYFQKKYPNDVLHAGALVADYGAAETIWNGEKAAMTHLGYKVIADPTFPTSQTDFNQNIISMKQAGVKILFLEQMPENYASSVIQALNQQNFHPVVVLGTSTYSEQLVPNSGGAAAIDGAYLEQPTSLFLGEDGGKIPAVSTFLFWVQKASPGFKADYYTLAGWLSAQLFVQALRDAGTHPSRGSVLQALRHITSFSGDYLVGTGNPADKKPTNCYVLARIVNGKFQRLDDPPVGGPTHGYRCDYPYYYPSS
jgi:branched-chain amino acid transport system substrate-binding protein